MRRSPAFLQVGLVLAVAACGGASAPGETAQGLPQPSVPIVDPLPDPIAPIHSGSPTTQPTDVRSTTRPLAMSDEERWALDVLREDAKVGCEPRRTDLPRGAKVGIECRISSRLVDRVGVYGFDHDVHAAAQAYLERMDRERVLGMDGDCGAGAPGDVPWSGIDGAEDVDTWQVWYEGSLYSTDRHGCFRNEQGFANYRATCNGHYVGVLGATSAIDALTDWALLVPEGEEPSEGPGICFGELGGGYIDCPDLEEGDVC